MVLSYLAENGACSFSEMLKIKKNKKNNRIRQEEEGERSAIPTILMFIKLVLQHVLTALSWKMLV